VLISVFVFACVCVTGGGSLFARCFRLQVVEAGKLQIHVGGGQPGFFQGGKAASVTISKKGALATC
jgi:hypothetical protein